MLQGNKSSRIPFRYLLVGGMLVILLMFIFERPVDGVLKLFGYDDGFVSYFPFVKSMYFHFKSSKKTSDISVTHFHLLDLALCLSIVVWGACLTAVIIHFKRYDDGFRIGLARISENYRKRSSVLYFCWVLMLCGPILVSI
jgi:hypothetical protein